VKSLALFPGVLVILLLLGALLAGRGRRTGRWVLIALAFFLYWFSTPYMGYGLLYRLEGGLEPLTDAQAKQAQAIVILSAGMDDYAPEYEGPAPGPLTLFRLRYGVHLYRKYQLPIVVSGGPVREGVLADVMADSLQEEHKIDGVWREARSRNTLENAKFSAALLQDKKIDTVLLVTHAWHMPRALQAFSTTAIRAIPAATGFTGTGRTDPMDFLPQYGALAASYLYIHEKIGAFWYQIQSR
ncbi:MAG: YdcF family protein, partial [Magnetospiraceae bacterium]